MHIDYVVQCAPHQRKFADAPDELAMELNSFRTRQVALVKGPDLAKDLLPFWRARF